MSIVLIVDVWLVSWRLLVVGVRWTRKVRGERGGR